MTDGKVMKGWIHHLPMCVRRVYLSLLIVSKFESELHDVGSIALGKFVSILLKKWSNFTRLVTRTKESNMYANRRAITPFYAVKTRETTQPFRREGYYVFIWYELQYWATILAIVKLRAHMMGPERCWTKLGQNEVWRNFDGGLKRCWRANHSSDLSLGAKD